jgi:hypothetical protein
MFIVNITAKANVAVLFPCAIYVPDIQQLDYWLRIGD